MNKYLKYGYILAVIGLVCGAAIYLYINYFAAPQETYDQFPLADYEIVKKIQTNQSLTTQPTSYAIEVSNFFAFAEGTPESTQAFNYTKDTYFTQERINSLLSAFGVKLISDDISPILGRVILASAGDKSLTIYPDKNEFTYVNISNTTDAGTSMGNFGVDYEISLYQKAAEQAAQPFNVDLLKYQSSQSRFRKLEGAHAKATSNPASANILELMFSAQVNGFHLVDQQGVLGANSLIVWLDHNQNVRKILFQPSGSIGTASGNYALKDQEQVISEVESGKAKLINGTFDPTEEITYVLVTNAELIYQAVDNMLVPAYRLKANVTTTGKGIGYLFLPAIKGGEE